MLVDGSKNISDELRKKRIIQVTWLAQMALLFAAFHPILESNWFNLLMLGIFFIAFIPCRYQAKKDRLDVAANLISLNSSVLILTFCWFNQGIRDESLLIFPALITFAVLTGRDKFIWFFYAIIACSIMVMGLLNEVGFHQHNLYGSGLSPAIIIVIILSVVTYSIKILGTDITSANKALQAHQQKLEKEVETRTEELQQSLQHLTEAKNELVQAEKMASLGRLVAGVAHEINTPLGIAITASSLIYDSTEAFQKNLHQGEVTKSNLTSYVDATDKSIAMIQGNLKRAANLITDFKQAAVLQSDEQLTTFNLYEILGTIIEYNQALHVGKEVTATVTGDKTIFITKDADAMTRIITNLYANSCIHGFSKKEQGQVNIDIHQKGEQVTIKYTDDGKGIKESNIKHIFEPFFTTRRGQGGTGLGMHIVFNLVTQSLKGQIEYKTEQTIGAYFEINFKIA